MKANEMNTDKDRWSELKRHIHAKWSKLSYREIDTLKNGLDGIVAKLQQAYGFAREHAEREYHDFRVTLFRPYRSTVRLVGPVGEKRMVRFAVAAHRGW